MDARVTAYIEKKEQWSKELSLLRETLLQLPVEETIKWGAPTYTFEGKNIVGLAAFKNYCGLWFFQGGLLKDTRKVLLNAQEGKTKAMLQWRFNSLEEIDADLLKSYVLEAIENQKSGRVIKPQRNTKPLVIPEILQKELDTNASFKEKFESFSLSHKREYANYVSDAKREATKQSRLEKIVPMILEKVGLHDKYKKC
ncbi:MAG: YdeI/OmpD-associated family protein [Flavobacteriaceae bacterium]|nr:YdeI/OmpD-associated family protein [Flavobacteriaceae bacterium]